MTSTHERFFDYWGKTHDDDYHLLPYHALDVAAVGYEYLAINQRLRCFLAHALGVPEETLMQWIGFFLSLHDIGKFAEAFQGQQPSLFQRLQGRQGHAGYKIRHDTLGYWAWLEWLAPLTSREDWLGLGINARSYRCLTPWVCAVTGHHGQPPEDNAQSQLQLLSAFPASDRQALIEFARVAHTVFWDKSAPSVIPSPQAEALKQASWWLAGLTVLADWLGSNRNYFLFRRDPIPLTDYWRDARATAQRALRESGALPSQSRPPQPFSALFPKLAQLQATPLQHLADHLPLVVAPQLFVLEDLTGSGKTEAALCLAHRLLAARSGDGLYFALPTMATANAMYRRVTTIYPHLFLPDASPSLVLAHSARKLVDPFRQSIPTSVEDDYPQDGQEAVPAGVRCAAWLADNRKKALLAPIGVGTIDQALLAILPARHQCLRLAGLFGKVLLVDEVHANDAYMHRLLCALLEFHAAAGGCAILLSATLPRKMRQELADAFQRGNSGKPVALTKPSYPLLTHITASGGYEYPVATQPSRRRRVAVRRLDAWEVLLTMVVEAAQAGHCVCWVRNTVADAREAYQALVERWSSAKLDLFHARFAMGDRLAMEEQVLQYFGPDSTAQDRQGRILVATQVVEQSLDLDFDVLVSDLAPIDLLIQRAGRLCRHPRNREGNRTNTEERDTPCLWLYGPAPDDEVPANWYRALLPRASFVYSNPAQLWRSARLLENRGGFTLPDEARELIENVFGMNALLSPTALDDADLKAWGEDRSKSAQAQNLSLALDNGYTREGFAWWDDTVTPTRLGEAETTLVLMRWDGRNLAPWCDGPHPWALSQVKMRQALAAEPAPVTDPTLLAALDAWRKTQPGSGRWLLPIPLTEIRPNIWHGEVCSGNGESLDLRYDQRLGLRRASEDVVNP